MQDVTKWDKFYNNQNATTKAWLDARAAEDNKLIASVAIPTFLLGLVFGFICGLGL
jgi:hypothetical protein